MQDASILVLEDEHAIAEMIEIILRKEGFLNITLCGTVQEAKKKIENKVFDFYLLDIMLPDGSGLDMANMIREQSDAPIFFLTAKGSDADKLRGFMNGADDYITKPFNPLELVARVKVQLARYIKKKRVPESHLFTCSRFTFDIDAAEITVNDTKEIISGRLFHLLKFLCENVGQVLSKEQIYERVWGDCLFDDNTVMVHIRKLREKIEKNPGKPTCIITVRGIGYKLVGDVQS
ncbi:MULTISPECIES: response regulator transcription factor [unclassified Lysinibacillus]|uniref:response regulator transcription factor n=1 Tax=unclassified Lysinibacillus TaxID=2636778 RepID=UPI002553972F|nr:MULTISPECIES: response regulator transcription factor [unclassified Lysinibacillus]MDM5246015.1 response regulator transcription factor [Lysinibacillus sp. G4S2]